MRVGIFGGSFDPVHLGHLWIAEAASESLQLDRLLWIPTARQPLKPDGATASDQQRIDMLRLAVSGREGHSVDEREIRREGVSFTIETVKELRQEDPRSEYFLVIGSDSLQSFDRWRDPADLLEMVTLAVVQRGGDDPIDFKAIQHLVDASTIERFKRSVIAMPVIEISSSEIRRRVREGRGIRYLVPRAVESYIDANHLYQKDSTRQE